jgi:hypothetical protein
VRIALGEQHVDDVVRQRASRLALSALSLLLDESRLGVVGQRGELGGVVRQDVVEFGDHRVHFRDELDQAFGASRTP